MKCIHCDKELIIDTGYCPYCDKEYPKKIVKQTRKNKMSGSSQKDDEISYGILSFLLITLPSSLLIGITITGLMDPGKWYIATFILVGLPISLVSLIIIGPLIAIPLHKKKMALAFNIHISLSVGLLVLGLIIYFLYLLMMK